MLEIILTNLINRCIRIVLEIIFLECIGFFFFLINFFKFANFDRLNIKEKVEIIFMNLINR